MRAPTKLSTETVRTSWAAWLGRKSTSGTHSKTLADVCALWRRRAGPAARPKGSPSVRASEGHGRRPKSSPRSTGPSPASGGQGFPVLTVPNPGWLAHTSFSLTANTPKRRNHTRNTRGQTHTQRHGSSRDPWSPTKSTAPGMPWPCVSRVASGATGAWVGALARRFRCARPRGSSAELSATH